MKKKGLLKGIVLSAACLLGFGTLIGATTGLSQNKTYEIAEAAAETKATLTKANIIDALSSGSSEATINGITFDWGDTEFTVSGSTLRVDQDHCANILVASSHLSSNNVTHVSVNISYTAPALNTKLQIIEGFTSKLVDISLTGNSYSSGDVSINNSKMLMIKIMNNGTDDLNNLTISSFSLDLKGIPAKSAVTIAKGTGVKSVYLSTSNTATSGSASGTEYDYGTTVYGFAELAKGYNAPSGWSLVSGTAHTEGAKYRVGSVTAGTNNFGTINASLATYSISYTLAGGSVSGNPTSYNVNSNAITLKNPTRTGYTFKGWTGSNGSTPQTSVTIAKGSVGNKTYTANWQVNTYNIAYTLNSGALPSGKTNPSTYNVETATFTLNNPQREGYNFVGWTGSNGSTPQTTVTITKGSTGNKSYTANWTLVQELQTVVDAINNLGGPINISYPGSKTNLENAESLYSALNPTLKSVLDTDYADLVDELADDRAEYEDLRSDAINDTISKIDAIGDDVSYPGSREVIFAARDALAGLDAPDRIDTVITNLNDYNDALGTYNDSKDIAVNQVIEVIDNIVTDGEGKAIYPNSKLSLENAESLYEGLAPEEKYPSSAVSNYNDLVTARSDYNASRNDALNETTNAIDAISKPFDGDRKEQIANAQQLFDDLDNSDKNATVITNLQRLEDAKAADAVADIIEVLTVVSDTNEFRESVSQARGTYNNLSDDQKGFIPSNILTLLVSREKALEVIDSIKDIGDITYPSSKAKIDTANALYATYIEAGYPTEFIVNYQTLVDANTLYDDVDAVADLIKAIPAASESDAYYNAVDLAKAEFDELSLQGQTLLANATFDESGITYAQHLVDQVAARDVIERIQDIGQVIYSGEDDSLEAINYAENGYKGLSEAQKTIVNGVNYSTLTKDKADYDAVDAVATLIELIPEAEASDEYYNAVNLAAANYAQLSGDQLAIINAATAIDYEKVLADHIAAKAVINEIANIGVVSYDGGVNDSLSKIVSAETNYGNLTPDQKSIVNSANYSTLTYDREVYDNVSSVAALIKAIPAASDSIEYYNAVDAASAAFNSLNTDEQNVLKASVFDDESGIKYSDYLADQVAAREVIERIQDIGTVVYGGEDDSLEAIKYAEEGYIALSNAQQAIVNGVNYNTLVHDREVYDHVDEVAELIMKIVPAEGESYYEAVKIADTAYKALTPEEQTIIDNSHEQDFEKILSDNVVASKVIQAIESIGKLTYNDGNNDSLNKIKTAEELYELLANDQKAIVDSVNHDTLVGDRASYDRVDAVVELIEKIGEVKHDEETQTQLIATRVAYDKLSEEEKALVSGYNNTYKVLVDDEHVYEALVKIDAIGEVSYDTRSEEAIKEAREYYDSLTEDQKKQLGDQPFATLSNAESTYANKKQGGTIVVIIFLIVACAAILVGAWFLIRIIKGKKNNNNNGSGKSGKKEPVKALSVGGLLPFITLISHYADATYIALYVLAGVAVLIWISILVFAIMKKKQIGPFKKKAEVAKVEPQAATTQNEDEEVETISDEKGNIFQIRYIKSFTAKLIQSPEETKKYYEELKNEVLSYKKTNSRVSWHYDAVNSGREYVLKFAIRGKTLCVYLPLDPEKVEEKYKVEKSESKRFEDVPCLYRIKNDRRRDYAKELIALVASNLGLEKGEEQHEVYSNLPYEPNKPLVARGLIKERKIKVNKPAEQQVLETKVSSDGDEIVITKDEKGNIFEIRYIKSFTAKLSQSEKEVKDYYTVLKNYVLSYKDAHSRVSWHYDAINVGRDYVMKFSIRGKTLCVYFALDASKLDEKYKVEEAKGKKFIDVAVLYRIKNDRRCQYAKELIDEVMKKAGASQGEIPTDNYAIPHESTKELLAKGLIKELKTAVKKPEVHHIDHLMASVSAYEVDKLMSDEDAEVMIEEDKSSKKHEGKKAIVNIDELEANFNDGDKVTLESLIEKGLVAKDVGRVKLLARGKLDKKLDVDLQDYSLQAVKMILLVGGKVQKAK